MKIKPILHFGVALLSIVVLSLGVCFFLNGRDLFSSWLHFFKNFSYGCTFGLLFWGSSSLIGQWIQRRHIWIRNPRRGTFLSLLLFILSGIAISLTVPYVFLVYVFQVAPEYLRFNILFTAFLTLAIDMIMVSVMFSKFLVNFWVESMQNEEKAKQEKLIAQFETLKNQVNPHFLFNSLNTLCGVVEQQPAEAVPFIRKLSDSYRYILELKERDVVPLEEELQFVDDYVYLMKIRHGEGFQLRYQREKKWGYVAPLALQMLVENALKHNVISDEQPLQIELLFEQHALVVRNNRKPKTSQLVKKPEGLDNLVRRYAHLSDKKVEIISTENEFVVKLPLLDKPEV